MKQILLASAMAFVALGASAGGFSENFCDSTLRVDYIFGGGPQGIQVLLDGQSKTAGWAGRRSHLNELHIKGNGEIQVIDPTGGELLYVNPFSTLYHEWLDTEEAATTQRSFENSFQVPLPKREADIRVVIRNNRQEEIGSLTTRYNPADELVAIKGINPLPHKYLHRGGDPKEAIDIAILAEGYTVEEMDSFINHAQKSVDEILSYEPFASYKDKLNFVAVMSPSKESGVSIPLKNEWKDTAFDAHFSTFHSPRYLTTSNVQRLYDALSGIPFEHIMIIVNTDQYGGGGILNSYHIAAAKNKLTFPVTVHEFGHSFAGLADEYFYTSEESDLYPLDIEPWERNITTLVDFDSKWKDMVTPGTPVPTPWKSDGGTRAEKINKKTEADKATENVVGAFEGGGYKEKGVYRPTVTCRMRDNYYPAFCPVCERAIRELIEFYLQ